MVEEPENGLRQKQEAVAAKAAHHDRVEEGYVEDEEEPVPDAPL